MYSKEISARLDRFIGNHMDYEDIGGPENGPHLVADYNGPGWAMDLQYMVMNPTEYATWGTDIINHQFWYDWFEDHDESELI